MVCCFVIVQRTCMNKHNHENPILHHLSTVDSVLLKRMQRLFSSYNFYIRTIFYLWNLLLGRQFLRILVLSFLEKYFVSEAGRPKRYKRNTNKNWDCRYLTCEIQSRETDAECRRVILSSRCQSQKSKLLCITQYGRSLYRGCCNRRNFSDNSYLRLIVSHSPAMFVRAWFVDKMVYEPLEHKVDSEINFK